MCAKACGFLRFLCRGSGRCGPWPSVRVARRGWGDRALFSAWTRERVVPLLLGRCSDLQSLLGVHLDVSRMGAVPPACQLSRPGGARDKAPFGLPATPKVTSLRDLERPSGTRNRFKSHNRVTIWPWLRSPDRPWQTLDN
jgi:hypothetical protein